MSFPFLQAGNGGGPWVQRVINGEADWSHRDGATMCVLDSKRILLIGGWNPGQWATESTNEIWKSDNGGKTWELLLSHNQTPPTSGAGARFRPVHTPAAVACDGYFYLIGSDAQTPHSEVWRTSLAGTGEVWERRTATLHADWDDRALGIAGSLDGVLYAMGGMLDVETPSSAQNDVYESTDGGATWTKMNIAVPWSPRAGVYGMPLIGDRIFLVSGGVYADECFDGVFAFDGAAWYTINADGTSPIPFGSGAGQTAGRYYHSVLRTPDGRVWIVGGSALDPANNIGLGSVWGIAASDDNCETWFHFNDIAWGAGLGTHADALAVFENRIVRASGNAFDRATLTINREAIPPSPTIVSCAPSTGPTSTVTTITGTGFAQGVLGVYVFNGGGPVEAANFAVVSDTALEVEMPTFPGAVVYFMVFGPGGQGYDNSFSFTYI
ncbi:MAG: IPT/TIG domain-containing protein [Myxococcales bacterium]|nr:IPT/TIG domain-containing protein [Myxococcales bacterium]